jgi:hypothetical protein
MTLIGSRATWWRMRQHHAKMASSTVGEREPMAEDKITRKLATILAAEVGGVYASHARGRGGDAQDPRRISRNI